LYHPEGGSQRVRAIAPGSSWLLSSGFLFMTIETKFNLRQEIFFFHKGRITKGRIDSVNIAVTPGFGDHDLYEEIIYTVRAEKIREKDAFESHKAIINKLSDDQVAELT